MDQAKAIEAAKLLAEARKTGVPIKELPPELRPAVAADSNQIAAEVTRMLGAQVAGWKITFLYKPREVPFQHPIYRNLMFSSPAKIPTSIAPSMFIEPEVTFRLTKDLPPREKLYNHEEVASSVDACPSMECVDTRYDTKYKTIRERLNERATLVEAYADNQTNGAFVIGEPVKDWRDIDFGAMKVRMSADDTTIVETVGGHAFTDPFPPVVVLANYLRKGPGLKTGQILATGSFSGFFPVELNQQIDAEFEGLGRARAMFVK